MVRNDYFLSLIERNRRWLLLAQLAILHLVLVQDIASPIARTLLVGHIGLFLLWQPIVRAETRLSWGALALTAAAVAFAALWASVWLLIVWVMVLAGIIGGKVFFSDSQGTRVFYLMALAYLVLALLVLLTPRVVPHPIEVPGAIGLLAHVGLPAMLALMVLVPVARNETEHVEVIDFVYSAFVFLLLAVLVLGALALMLLSSRGYVESLAITLLVISVVLFFLGWAWNPRAGFSGLGLVVSRYVLSVVLPFDWLHDLTELSAREADPIAFVDHACRSLMRFPGLIGGAWRVDGSEGHFGGEGKGRRYEFSHGDLRLTLSARRSLGPSLVWHFQMLAQVLGEFQLAKTRARQLQQLSYLKAVHETGARLTHDVKNLLQSLNTLCFAAEREGADASPQFQSLLLRQLPAISQRLQQTLEKLKQPTAEAQQEVPVKVWWDGVLRRYTQEHLRLFAIGMGDELPVPAGFFNSTLENLVENALRKHATTPGLAVSVTLDMTQGLTLKVCDNGEPIPAAIAKDLFRAPVASEFGLGIGLYQVARQAEWYGYALMVAANGPGQVCIELKRVEPGVHVA